ncbi:MAG: hypothetical protein ACYTXT_39965 [Nostoc sp.]
MNQSDYSKNCQPEDVVTIWINSDDIVWVKMTHGYARYHKEPFSAIRCLVNHGNQPVHN